MKYILPFILFLPLFLHAQTNQNNYLEGAVPEVNGRVIFSTGLNVPNLNKDEIYEVVLKWAQARFNDEDNRVVYSDKEKGDIAASGKDYLVFSSSALSLDRSIMQYRMVFECEDHLCRTSVIGIRYEYNVAYQREPEKYTADEWITDKYALNKGKLNRHNGKFRTATIDYVNELFSEVKSALGATVITDTPSVEPVIAKTQVTEAEQPFETVSAQPQTIVSPAQPLTPAQPSALSGYKQIAPDQIPGNIIKMLSEDWMLITAGNDAGFNMMTASWGGLGYLLGKPVAFCFINPARYTYQLMEKNDTFTLTFYTEAYRKALEYCGSTSGKDTDKVKGSGLTPITTPEGSKAFGEAWMIIECRKLISQSLSTESISNEKVREEWLGKQVNKMYAGEIINVWIK